MVALGIGKTIYSSWGYHGLFDMVGDVLYEMAWIWFAGAWKVRWPVKEIAIATFLLTALIEISQLIPFPQTWISQLWWRLLLGTHFAWLDFIYYAVGCVLGGISLSWLRSRCGVIYHHKRS